MRPNITRSPATRRPALAGALALLLSSTAQGQANPDSIKLRDDCRLAEQVLSTGQPATHRQDALSIIGHCGREGIPATIAAWSSAGSDQTELQILVTATRAFASQEITDALVSTVGQASRPLEVRVAALQVLITFADPAAVPAFRDLVGDSTALLIHFYGRVDHPFPVVGRETLTGSLTDRLRTVLGAVASSDGDARMRVAARVALQNSPLK